MTTTVKTTPKLGLLYEPRDLFNDTFSATDLSDFFRWSPDVRTSFCVRDWYKQLSDRDLEG